MKNTFENGILTIFPENSIDTNNAEAVGAEIAAIRAEHPEGKLVLDMDDLRYISSAGLRQILKLKKKEKDFAIINCSSEVYEIFEMTGFAEMMDISKGFRKMSVEGCEVIGEGSNGIVYRLNPDTIIKVYKHADALEDIKRERDLARRALVMGINTAIPFDVVKVGDKYGSVFELLSAKSLTKLIVAEPENREKYVKVFADMLKEIHETDVKEGLLPELLSLVEQTEVEAPEIRDLVCQTDHLGPFIRQPGYRIDRLFLAFIPGLFLVHLAPFVFRLVSDHRRHTLAELLTYVAYRRIGIFNGIMQYRRTKDLIVQCHQRHQTKYLQRVKDVRLAIALSDHVLMRFCRKADRLVDHPLILLDMMKRFWVPFLS